MNKNFNVFKGDCRSIQGREIIKCTHVFYIVMKNGWVYFWSLRHLGCFCCPWINGFIAAPWIIGIGIITRLTCPWIIICGCRPWIIGRLISPWIVSRLISPWITIYFYTGIWILLPWIYVFVGFVSLVCTECISRRNGIQLYNCAIRSNHFIGISTNNFEFISTFKCLSLNGRRIGQIPSCEEKIQTMHKLRIFFFRSGSKHFFVYFKNLGHLRGG